MNPPTQVNAMRISAHLQPSLPRSRPATRIPTVCVVDPRADDYQGWNELAEASGLQFQIVGSSQEALRFSRGQTVDLWVINTELPDLSGNELCAMLKIHSPRTDVFLLTDAYAAESERLAWQARATCFGCKGNLDQWLRQWIAHSQCRHDC